MNSPRWMAVRQDLNCSRKFRSGCTEGKTAVANDCGALAPESVQIFGTPWREHAESPVEYGNREIFAVFPLDTIPVSVDNCLRIERGLVWL